MNSCENHIVSRVATYTRFSISHIVFLKDSPKFKNFVGWNGLAKIQKIVTAYFSGLKIDLLKNFEVQPQKIVELQTVWLTMAIFNINYVRH